MEVRLFADRFVFARRSSVAENFPREIASVYIEASSRFCSPGYIRKEAARNSPKRFILPMHIHNLLESVDHLARLKAP